jgi:hypothetical protein
MMEIQYWLGAKLLKTERKEKRETVACVGDYVSMIVGEPEDWDEDKYAMFVVKRRCFMTEEFTVQLLLEWVAAEDFKNEWSIEDEEDNATD